jgi:hypothetical protein
MSIYFHQIVTASDLRPCIDGGTQPAALTPVNDRQARVVGWLRLVPAVVIDDDYLDLAGCFCENIGDSLVQVQLIAAGDDDRDRYLNPIIEIAVPAAIWSAVGVSVIFCIASKLSQFAAARYADPNGGVKKARVFLFSDGLL